ncbi:MAG: DNA polymerase domain-containing protein [Candidatus Hodarchaeales archaeon]|jgi:DNA polymerase I
MNEIEIEFILLDADYSISNDQRSSNIHLWGKTGHKRVEVVVTGFFPYFYAEGPEDTVQKLIRKNGEFLRSWVIRTELCHKQTYFGAKKKTLTKIVGRRPYQVPKVRSIFERNGLQVFEADIPFTKRFLIDQKLKALQPLTVKGLKIIESSEELVLKVDYQNIHVSDSQITDYQPVFLAFDIEVDEHGETFQELYFNKIRRITAISYAWGKAGVDKPEANALLLTADSDTAEKRLLTDFIINIRRIAPDVLVSFNGTYFDIPYLKARVGRYGLSLGSLALFEKRQGDIIRTNVPVDGYRLKGRAVVDLIPKARYIHPLSGQKNLDTIASMLLGETKVKSDKSLGELWRNSIKGSRKDGDLFYQYSITDSILTFRLVAELGVNTSVELCKLAGYLLPEGLLSTSRNIGEFELMRILHERDILVPSKPTKSEISKRNSLKEKYPHLGGWVIDPEVDEALFVAIFDFRSLYPNIVRTHNISGETLIPRSESKDPEDRFLTKPRGAFADLMDRILEKRYQAIKQLNSLKRESSLSEKQGNIHLLEKQQNSLKLMANSLCGAANYPRGRFYHHLLSNSITGIARELLGERLQNWTKQFSQTHNYTVEVRYGDTDSIFCEFISSTLNPSDFLISVPYEKRNKSIELLENYIHEYRQYLSMKLPDLLELKLEDIAFRIILKKGRKKAYAYLSLLTQDVIIRGFEAVRSDWSPLAKKTQRKLLEILLMDFSDNRLQNARKFVIQTCRFILKSPTNDLFSELSIRGPVKRAPTEYKTRTPAIGAFLNYCKAKNLDPEVEWKQWDGFPYIIAKSALNQPQFKRAYHPDVFRTSKRKIDRFHYIKEILGASNRFGISLNENEALHGRFIIPLTEFFPQNE